MPLSWVVSHSPSVSSINKPDTEQSDIIEYLLPGSPEGRTSSPSS